MLSGGGRGRGPRTVVFFFNDTATTEIYTLSLHDALPIFTGPRWRVAGSCLYAQVWTGKDRKSTRLNSSHVEISYAVFCLKKNNPNSSLRARLGSVGGRALSRGSGAGP